MTSLILSLERLTFVTEPEVVLDEPTLFQSHSQILSQNVTKILIPDLDLHRKALSEPVNVRDGDLDVHVFSLTETGPENELLDGGEEELAAGRIKGCWSWFCVLYLRTSIFYLPVPFLQPSDSKSLYAS